MAAAEQDTTTVEPTDEVEERDDAVVEDKVQPDDDWKAKARKHESSLKKERKAREDLEKRLKDFEDRDKTEQEKALEEAYGRGKTEALTEFQKERRTSRLEVETTRFSTRGIQVGGDELVKFVDPKAAVKSIKAAIADGEVDEAEIFDDDGKVKADGLQEALARILEDEPYLRSSDTPGKPKGSPDTRRGNAADTDLEAMSARDHERRKYPGNFK